jgi:hypothetical protein
MMHSDRESLFRNIEKKDFLDHNQIKISVGSAKAHSNQVLERCFCTLKNIIRRSFEPLWKEGQPDPLNKERLDSKTVAHFVNNAIEQYNNKPHKALYVMSPNRMEETLLLMPKVYS